MTLPSGSSIGSATESTSRSISPGAVAPSRSPSAPTALICCRAAAIAVAMRVSLFVCSVVNARPRCSSPGVLGSGALWPPRRAPGARARSRRVGAADGARRWSGAEDGGGDAQAGGRRGEAGLVFARGDLAGDRAELGGDRRLARLHALERVEDQVVLGAARGEDAHDVLEAAAADVRDEGLHVAGPRAGAGGAPDALFEAGLHPRQVEVDDYRAVLQVVPLPRDRAQAEHRKLTGLEGALEPPEGDLVDRAVGDVRLDAVALDR